MKKHKMVMSRGSNEQGIHPLHTLKGNVVLNANQLSIKVRLHSTPTKETSEEVEVLNLAL